jgi:ankyrin repeat protein
VLISAGAEVNARDNDGMTPLMNAAGFNTNPEVAQLLIKAGVRPQNGDEFSTRGFIPL